MEGQVSEEEIHAALWYIKIEMGTKARRHRENRANVQNKRRG